MKLKFCVKEIPRVELDVEGASADDSGKVCKEQRQQDAIRCLNLFQNLTIFWKKWIIILHKITLAFGDKSLSSSSHRLNTWKEVRFDEY